MTFEAQLGFPLPFECMPTLIDTLRDQTSQGLLLGRPFLCSGHPENCTIALIGINPASNNPFWDYWDDQTGFRREEWIQAYAGSPSRSRRAIERLIPQIKDPVIELNLYTPPSKRLADLSAPQRLTATCDIILNKIRPKAIILAGSKVAQVLKSCTFDWAPHIVEARHFIHWGREYEKQLAEKINALSSE